MCKHVFFLKSFGDHLCVFSFQGSTPLALISPPPVKVLCSPHCYHLRLGPQGDRGGDPHRAVHRRLPVLPHGALLHGPGQAAVSRVWSRLRCCCAFPKRAPRFGGSFLCPPMRLQGFAAEYCGCIAGSQSACPPPRQPSGGDQPRDRNPSRRLHKAPSAPPPIDWGGLTPPPAARPSWAASARRRSRGRRCRATGSPSPPPPSPAPSPP